MKFTLIKKYFNFIEKHIQPNGYFLNINRFEKHQSDIQFIFMSIHIQIIGKKYYPNQVLNRRITYFLCKYEAQKNNISVELNKIKEKYQKILLNIRSEQK